MHLKYIVLFIGLLSMFFASLQRNRFRYGLEVAWLIIFIFLAIRYDFGNDYMGYLEYFNEINSQSSFTIDVDSNFEPGWQILCRLFGPLGFSSMVIVLTAIECVVFYKFIKQYVPEKYYWFAVLLYVFNPSLMLIGASMMRNTLAIALFVWSVKYIHAHRLLPFILLITIATQIHSSAVVLYPFYLLGYLDKVKFSVWVSVAIIASYIVLDSISANFQLGGIVESMAEFAGEEEALEYYTESHESYNMQTRQGTGLGVIIVYFIFGYLVMTIGRYSQKERLIFLLLIIGTFVRPFAYTLYALARFTYYFSIFQIVCYPIILFDAMAYRKDDEGYSLTLNRISKLAVIFCVFFTTIRGYLGFFNDEVWQDKFSEYHTIFDVN